MSHKFSTALRYAGPGAGFVGFATLQGVDPASPANLHESPTSTRPPFARYEFCETCGLTSENIIKLQDLLETGAFFCVLYGANFIHRIMFEEQKVVLFHGLLQKLGFFFHRQ